MQSLQFQQCMQSVQFLQFVQSTQSLQCVQVQQLEQFLESLQSVQSLQFQQSAQCVQFLQFMQSAQSLQFQQCVQLEQFLESLQSVQSLHVLQDLLVFLTASTCFGRAARASGVSASSFSLFILGLLCSFWVFCALTHLSWDGRTYPFFCQDTRDQRSRLLGDRSTTRDPPTIHGTRKLRPPPGRCALWST